MKVRAVAAALVALALASPLSALAEVGNDEKSIDEAILRYERLETKAAITLLLSLDPARMDTKLRAKYYVHLGAFYADSDRPKDAVKAYALAVKAQPSVLPPRSASTLARRLLEEVRGVVTDQEAQKRAVEAAARRSAEPAVGAGAWVEPTTEPNDAALGVAIGGGAVTAAGIAALIVARVKVGEANDSTSASGAQGTYDDAATLNAVGIAGTAVGAAIAAGGIVWWLLAPTTVKKAGRRGEPLMGAGSDLEFSFDGVIWHY